MIKATTGSRSIQCSFRGTPDYTFNGYMFAVLGLWDYRNVTQDSRAARLCDASLTTLDKTYPKLRNPGGYSHYCRTHQLPMKGHHAIHIRLYRQFTDLSGDQRFARYAVELASDV